MVRDLCPTRWRVRANSLFFGRDRSVVRWHRARLEGLLRGSRRKVKVGRRHGLLVREWPPAEPPWCGRARSGQGRRRWAGCGSACRKDATCNAQYEWGVAPEMRMTSPELRLSREKLRCCCFTSCLILCMNPSCSWKLSLNISLLNFWTIASVFSRNAFPTHPRT